MDFLPVTLLHIMVYIHAPIKGPTLRLSAHNLLDVVEYNTDTIGMYKKCELYTVHCWLLHNLKYSGWHCIIQVDNIVVRKRKRK